MRVFLKVFFDNAEYPKIVSRGREMLSSEKSKTEEVAMNLIY